MFKNRHIEYFILKEGENYRRGLVEWKDYENSTPVPFQIKSNMQMDALLKDII